MNVWKIISVITGILMMIAGLFCMLNPGITYLSIGYAVGVSMLLDALGRGFAWWQFRQEGTADGWMLAGAVISAAFGILLMGNGALQLSVDAFIAYMTAIWILIHAVMTIVRSFRARKFHKALDTQFLGRHWWVEFALGVIMCVFAILSIINPIALIAAIGAFIGLGIIVSGANMITLTLTLA